VSKLIHGFAAVAAAGIGLGRHSIVRADMLAVVYILRLVLAAVAGRDRSGLFFIRQLLAVIESCAVCKAIESIRVSDYSYRFLLYAIVWYGTLAVDGWAVTFGTGWQFWNTC